MLITRLSSTNGHPPQPCLIYLITDSELDIANTYILFVLKRVVRSNPIQYAEAQCSAIEAGLSSDRDYLFRTLPTFCRRNRTPNTLMQRLVDSMLCTMQEVSVAFSKIHPVET